jgi:O-antigen/teichoic acid export membrane protein
MSTSKQIGINVLTQWLSFILRAGIGIVLVPFLIRELGRDVYGLAILLGVIISFAEVADMGLRAALGRHLSEALAENNMDAYNSLAATAVAIWLSVGGILAVACAIFSGSIVAFLDIPVEIQGDANLLVMLFGSLSILMAFIQPLFSAILSSSNRFDVINRLAAGHGLTTGVLLFLVLSYSDSGIYGWGVVMLGGKVLFLIISAVVALRVMPSFQFSLKRVSWVSFRKLFSLSGYLFFLNLTNLLSSKVDPIILSRFLGPASLALYNPGLTLSSRVRPLVLVLANQLYPVTTKFHTTGDDAQMKKVLFVGTRLTLCMGIGVFAILGVLSQSICRVWLEGTLGQEYQVAGYILLGWALIDLFQAAAGSQWPVMIGKNKVRFVAYTQFPLSILNIFASVYLVNHTSLGVVAVIVPTVIIGAVRRVITTCYVRSLLDLKWGDYLRHAYLRPVIVGCLLIPIASLVSLNFPANSIVELMVPILIISILWCVLFGVIGVLPEERSLVYQKISEKSPFKSKET